MFFRKFFGLAFMVLVIGGLIAFGYSLGTSGAAGAVNPIAPTLRIVLFAILGLWLMSFLVGDIFRFGMMRRWRQHHGYDRGYHRSGWGHWGHYKGKGRIPSGKGYWEWRDGEPLPKENQATDSDVKDAATAV